MLLGPDDVRNGHIAVVDNDGKDEQRLTVRPRDDEVLDRAVGELDVASDDVVDDGDTLVVHCVPEGSAGSPLQAAMTAVAVVARGGAVLRALANCLACAV